MDVLAHCRIYPLANYIRPELKFINISNDLIINNNKSIISVNDHLDDDKNDDNNTNKVALAHLIEHEFKLTTFKKKLLIDLITIPNHEKNGKNSYLIIDISSTWKQYLIELFDRENNQTNFTTSINYMNSFSILNMDGLINFLMQLNGSPIDALKRCQQYPSTSSDSIDQYQLSGIIIDNLSYISSSSSSSTSTFPLLLKLLKLLRKSFGCWIFTTSYGISYYKGIENSLESSPSSSSIHLQQHSKKLPTYFPESFINGMDMILLHETELKSRIL
ncbi:Psy3p NDAI_0J02090 [Naumovozyma dairenensis CBS 421]|uniref:Elongator complex protein 5 n=1 Tax=Naumovozyma dairenensis (strain ATCC 10597 / BCRC 20456 / CBS 421 / NBRC 0211 / NRRL Y-12639) TaxID=1071378 RepID=G0WH23_NAUDC|nr:hypothetical protein NDAI_0J02090 [Naumovozyma dairenensis CBS 421]CCD27101.1 hypothetical protein NDAI_0J02090 [Naumovozyma dairenensis CBS 421]